jgi:hypothetical protein
MNQEEREGWMHVELEQQAKDFQKIEALRERNDLALYGLRRSMNYLNDRELSGLQGAEVSAKNLHVERENQWQRMSGYKEGVFEEYFQRQVGERFKELINELYLQSFEDMLNAGASHLVAMQSHETLRSARIRGMQAQADRRQAMERQLQQQERTAQQLENVRRTLPGGPADGQSDPGAGRAHDRRPHGHGSSSRRTGCRQG